MMSPQEHLKLLRKSFAEAEKRSSKLNAKVGLMSGENSSMKARSMARVHADRAAENREAIRKMIMKLEAE
jgi:hypothetical protein